MIRLIINQIMESKGIEKPLKYLAAAGLTKRTAGQLLRNDVSSIRYEHIEIFCLLFDCAPSDLFVWIPEDKTERYKNYKLQTIRAHAKKETIKDMINALPLDKVKELEELIANF